MKPKIIKVCGLRDGANIRRVEQLAPDWMGFICWSGSARHVGEVPTYMPSACRRVGVFVNATPDFILQRTASLGLHILQFHGQESPGFCHMIREKAKERGHKVEIMKAFPVKAGEAFPDTRAYESCCDYFLFDTYTARMGGSGRTFDWGRLGDYQGNTPFLLSGGIGPEHLDALRRMDLPRCVGVDLNSRFEVGPALKDVQRLESFIRALRES